MNAQGRVLDEDRYCKLFVDYESSRESLIRMVCGWTDGRTERWDIATTWGEIYVDDNGDFDVTRKVESDAFLYYRYFLDVNPYKETTDAEYVRVVGHLLTRFWDSQVRAVAACDFEEQLPRRGGYNPGRKSKEG